MHHDHSFLVHCSCYKRRVFHKAQFLQNLHHESGKQLLCHTIKHVYLLEISLQLRNNDYSFCRLKQRKAVEEEVLPAVESEEEEEEESEYETDSEDEQMGRQMMKPLFVTKKDRETIAEREALEKEEQDAMQQEKVYSF